MDRDRAANEGTNLNSQAQTDQTPASNSRAENPRAGNPRAENALNLPARDDQARTKSVYTLQWNRFRIVRSEEDDFTFRNRTGWTEADLAGSLVLDAGCGMGRYARIASRMGGRVVGVDISDAVSAARDLNTDRSITGFVKADLVRLPFREQTFDRIYSIGVLDHTPDPRRSFLALTGLLKPGGEIAIWIYRKERPIVERIIDIHRAISKRLPTRLLLAMSRLSAPVGGIKRRLSKSRLRPIQRLGVALHLLTIGVSMHPDPEVRVCDTFDWYAPKYMSRHTFEEVAEWCREAGLVAIDDRSKRGGHFHEGQGIGVNATAKRPG
jgi:SAM-dependent methyltransferase